METNCSSELFEKDHNEIYTLLDTTITDDYGLYAFPSRQNYWPSDNGPLNIVLRVYTAYPTNDYHYTIITQVTDFVNEIYNFDSLETRLTTDGSWTKDFVITNGWASYQAIWIFEDMRNAWNYVYNNDFHYDPGNIKAAWQVNANCYPITIPGWQNQPFCGSFTYGLGGLQNFVFISNADNEGSMDVVVHEIAHLFMVNSPNGYWYAGCPIHYINSMSDIHCGWTEGWADFLPLLVNNDTCYNFSPNPCTGIPDQNYINLEVHSRVDTNYFMSWGAQTEGRVAAALYDFEDINNEGYDLVGFAFAPIADIALGGSQITTFNEFWNAWLNNGHEYFPSGLTLWWNTIDYVNVQQTFLPVIKR